MPERGWTKTALQKYILLEIPPLLLFAGFLWLIRLWTGLPVWACGVGLGLWVIKDSILFFYTWPAYDAGTGNRFSLLNQTGITEEALNPSGYIRIRGERWRARPGRGLARIESGQRVRVLAEEGLTLVVEPEPPASAAEMDSQS